MICPGSSRWFSVPSATTWWTVYGRVARWGAVNQHLMPHGKRHKCWDTQCLAIWQLKEKWIWRNSFFKGRNIRSGGYLSSPFLSVLVPVRNGSHGSGPNTSKNCLWPRCLLRRLARALTSHYLGVFFWQWWSTTFPRCCSFWPTAPRRTLTPLSACPSPPGPS